MGEVFDFFSKQNMTRAQQDYAANDRAADERGVYVGVLPKNEAQVVRDLIDQLSRKKAQIDKLIAEYRSIYDGYAFMMLAVSATLDIDLESFDPSEHDLYVDKNGHAWVVAKQKEPTDT